MCIGVGSSIFINLAEVGRKRSFVSGSMSGQGRKTLKRKKKIKNLVLWRRMPVRKGSRMKNLGQLRWETFMLGSAGEEWISKNKGKLTSELKVHL